MPWSAPGNVSKRGLTILEVGIALVLLALIGGSTLLVMANFSRSLVQLFSFAMLLSTAATLLPYAFSSAAALRKLRAGRIVAALALMFSLYALAGIGTESLIWGAVLVLAGLPIYFWEVRRR